MALGNNLKKKPQSVAGDESKEKKTGMSTIESIGVEGLIGDQEQTLRSEMMCVFQSGGEEYALRIDDVSEVVKLSAIAPVPQMPEYIVGMVNVRGNIFGVLDLAVFFGNEQKADDNFCFLIVIDHEEQKIAIRIPTVPDTLQVSEEMIEKLSSSMLKSIRKQEFLKGIIKKDNRMIILLNILDMISSDTFVNQDINQH